MNSTMRALVRKADVRGSAKSILYFLVDLCWGTRTSCYPSIGAIRKFTGFSERTVQRGICLLEDKQIITVVPRFSSIGKQQSNRYIINGLADIKGSKKISPPGCQSDTHKYSDIVNKSYDSQSEPVNSSLAPGSGNDFLNLSEPKPEAESKTEPEVPASVTPQEETRPTRQEASEHCTQAAKVNTPKTDQPGGSRHVSKASKARPATKAGAVRFEGDLNLEKVLEIHTYYTRMGYLKKSMSDLIDFLCACSRINRLLERKKCRNVFGLLTYLTKHKKLLDGVSAKDEQKANDAVRHLTRTGAIAF